jgi:hypothetical protein
MKTGLGSMCDGMRRQRGTEHRAQLTVNDKVLRLVRYLSKVLKGLKSVELCSSTWELEDGVDPWGRLSKKN